MTNLTLAEMETHLNMTGDDRSTWQVSTDDQVMQRRLEAIDAKHVRTSNDGSTKFYELRADQVLLRKGKRTVSEATRAQSAARLREYRETLGGA